MGRFSTVDLLIKEAGFVKKVNNIFSIKMSYSELVSTRRSTVLSLPAHSKASLVFVSRELNLSFD
jgi:hypothetical protein